MRVLVTGASGTVGAHLVPQLVEHGHQVTGTTRSPGKRATLRALGADAELLDGLDAVAVEALVARVAPDAIVHEMTALAGRPDLRHFDRWFAGTNMLRTRGTHHLLAASQAVGVKRFITQSYTGWNTTRDRGPVTTEADGFDPEPVPAQRETLAALIEMERAVLSAPLDGIVLRYANLYGPSALEPSLRLLRRRMFPIVGDGGGIWSWLHVEDAASATVAALERGRPGIYNVADDEPAKVEEWLPYLADVIGAPKPMRVPVWLGRLLAGDVAVRWMTDGRGSSNAKARSELGWRPSRATWREGFRELATAPRWMPVHAAG